MSRIAGECVTDVFNTIFDVQLCDLFLNRPMAKKPESIFFNTMIRKDQLIQIYIAALYHMTLL